jgi:hypothetical protein
VKLQLKPNENVLYPQPYVEQEYNPLIVTTLRVLWSGDNPKKPKEVDAAKITYVAKGFHQKFVKLMLIFGLLGAPFLGIGVYKYWTNRNLPMEPPEKVEGQKMKPLTQNDLKVFQSNKNNFVIGIVMGVFGAAMGGVAYLLYKRRMTVVIAGQGRKLEIPVKDAITQDKLLTMVNAAKTAAAALAPMTGPAGADAAAGKVQKQGTAPPKLSK